MSKKITSYHEPDIILIGASIMSATLGVLIKELDPQKTMVIFPDLSDSVRSEDFGDNFLLAEIVLLSTLFPF